MVAIHIIKRAWFVASRQYSWYRNAFNYLASLSSKNDYVMYREQQTIRILKTMQISANKNTENKLCVPLLRIYHFKGKYKGTVLIMVLVPHFDISGIEFASSYGRSWLRYWWEMMVGDHLRAEC